MKKKSHFTLVELLIVTAIIAILAGLLFPAINHAREKAKGTGCGSNYKGITSAWAMSADDHDGYVVAWRTRGHSSSSYAWGWKLYSDGYIKHHKAFYCPKATIYTFDRTYGQYDVAHIGNDPTHPEWEYSFYCCTIGYNFTYIGSAAAIRPDDPDAVYEPARISELRNPSRKAVFADSGDTLNFNAQSAFDGSHVGQTLAIRSLHGNKAAVAFVDGHHEMFKNARETIQYKWGDHEWMRRD